jgi:hypothetical protein
MNIVFRIGVATATLILIGFSCLSVRYFLLLRQKKVSKEIATLMPFASCAPGLSSGLAIRDILVPLAKCALRSVPDLNPGTRRGIWEFFATCAT